MDEEKFFFQINNLPDGTINIINKYLKILNKQVLIQLNDGERMCEDFHDDICFKCIKGQKCLLNSFIHCLKCKEQIDCEFVGQPDHFSDNILYICSKCNILYNLCYPCAEKNNMNTYFMNIVSVEISSKDSPLLLNKSSNYDIMNNSEMNGVEYAKFNEELDLIYYQEDKYGPIFGNDGGFYSEWKCSCCKNTVFITDK